MNRPVSIVRCDADYKGTAPQSGVNDGSKLLYIERLKEIYKRKNGEELSNAQALIIFEQLICLVKAVYQPIPPKNNLPLEVPLQTAKKTSI